MSTHQKDKVVFQTNIPPFCDAGLVISPFMNNEHLGTIKYFQIEESVEFVKYYFQ